MIKTIMILQVVCFVALGASGVGMLNRMHRQDILIERMLRMSLGELADINYNKSMVKL